MSFSNFDADTTSWHQDWVIVIPILSLIITVIIITIIMNIIFAGNAGRPIEVISNYFKLQSQPDWHLYQYHVDFNPEVDSKRIRQAMMWEQRHLLGEVKVFDGMIMFLQKKLPQKVRFYFLVSSAASDSAGPATLPVSA